ncbi:putative DNA-(apurinic or apyrimidinic site) endonuclease 2 [Seiridium cardinale]|uniref:DNA-(apurinic or apyrimidinic site) endonuclease 2 n=1 Tax=Seiridium cardinale TaxID=138064 RepID=A0ABR2XU88_9PEZI
MVVRITSWNVNGIRNPFSYQPWREKRTFTAMFDILEADIVVMQETKIQRKDLQDDMVLVPGWDVYFSLPKHKKGYSGVAIYTRNSVCAPIRAEEGITGILPGPNSPTSFRDLPEDQQIGGYPKLSQLPGIVDEATLDSEGRCVILEFPAFVLIGTYSPATRDDTRDDFKQSYLAALAARVRNLVEMGKRVVLTGDLNIIRAGIDTAGIAERLKKESLSMEDFFSSPGRRLFNQLVFEGDVYGARDEGREKPALWDLGRLFNPTREGMYTCWETKKNARPGNFGSRIDYVLCSDNMKNWFIDSNIQEGLHGSDHCPVFATISDTVDVDGKEVHVRDVINPPGVFKNGERLREWTTKDLLPLSAKLIPEFDRRRNIKDMFFKKASTTPKVPPTIASETAPVPESTLSENPESSTASQSPSKSTISAPSPSKSGPVGIKRTPSSGMSNRPQKKTKATLSKEPSISKGQSSLMGFFKPKSTGSPSKKVVDDESQTPEIGLDGAVDLEEGPVQDQDTPNTKSDWATPVSPDRVFDPIQNKESWSKILGKRIVPKCEHGEDCISLLTKKPGINCGRSFYMCSRPLGPSGDKERNTQWRCRTFIWSSDWNGSQSSLG